MKELAAKTEAIAKLIDGRVVDDHTRVAVCIKGSIHGFPITVETIGPSWPFGVMYTLETKIVVDPNRSDTSDFLKMTITPRMGKGLFSFLSHVLLFESKGFPVHEKSLDSKFIFSYNDGRAAENFVKYPNVAEHLIELQNASKFSELVIKSNAGIFLQQPTSFEKLDSTTFLETCRYLAKLGQVLFEAF